MKMFRRLLFFSLIVSVFTKKYLLESEGKAGKSGDYVDSQIKNQFTNGDARVKPIQVDTGDKESQSGEKENIGGKQDVEKNFNRHIFTSGKT